MADFLTREMTNARRDSGFLDKQISSKENVRNSKG